MSRKLPKWFDKLTLEQIAESPAPKVDTRPWFNLPPGTQHGDVVGVFDTGAPIFAYATDSGWTEWLVSASPTIQLPTDIDG